MFRFPRIVIALVVLVPARGFRHEIVSNIGENVELSCVAKSKLGVGYRSVIWYKVTEQPSRFLNGLLLRKLTKNNTRVERYRGVLREMDLLENSTSLLLPKVTAEDSGLYSCFLSAPLGHQNQEGEIHLKVHDYSEANITDYLKPNLLCGVAALCVALLMFSISYACVRNIPQDKKLSKKSLLISPLCKDAIDSLHSTNAVCKAEPKIFV